jgi:hypothetical protein
VTRRLPTALVVCLLGLVAAVACNEHVPQRFPHGLHLTQIKCGGPGLPDCVSCPTCHQFAHQNVSPLPSVQICTRCHKKHGEEALQSIRPPSTVPEEIAHTVHFPHAKHLAMPKIRGQCVKCHPGTVDTTGGKTLFPPMEKCFGCHEHQEQWNKNECAPCHKQSDLTRIMPQTFMRHDEAFQRKHGRFARARAKLCQQCHTQSQCDDCHDISQDLSIERRHPESIERAFVHRGDFITRHPIEARSEPQRCLTCHTPNTCDSCHVERGVSANAVNGLSPHPRGWVGNDPNGHSLHGRAARRDILTCAGCHDQGPATNCIRCHKVGGYGGNPHPSGWKSARSEGAEMCRYCHE